MHFENSGFRMFSIAGIDVSVSFWYFLLMGMFAFGTPGVPGILLVLAITISILIHEFGHAVPSKMYRLQPSILLHGFGGLCRHEPADSDYKDILIIVAGPLVQIAVGLVAFAILPFIGTPGVRLNFELFVYYFAWVSVIWGAINLLLPIFPLDGGQLFHMFLRRFISEGRAQDIALKVSILLTVVCGIWAISSGWWFGAFMAAFIVMGNVTALQSGASLVDRRAKVRTSGFVKETLRAAEAAFAAEDWREAARLCHVLRAANDPIPKKQMARIWEILALATMSLGEHEEARGWLKRAPDTPEVLRARSVCDAELAAN